jgi:acylphosphatase
MDQGIIRLHVLIDGRVQGVGFRYFVLEKANLLKIGGWVRNTSDGQVEVTAEGNKDSLDKLFNYLKRGPNMAYVTDIQQTWLPATGEFVGFNIKTSWIS